MPAFRHTVYCRNDVFFNCIRYQYTISSAPMGCRTRKRVQSDPVRLAQSVERCGSQSEGPGFKSRRRRWDSSARQTANGSCLSRLSCINEYKVFLRCLPVYGGTTSATIRWCNGASPEVLRKKHLFPKGLLKKKQNKKQTKKQAFKCSTIHKQ